MMAPTRVEGASWSRGAPPSRPATAEDWQTAPRLCSLSWAAWLVGLPTSTFKQLVARDGALRERLSYAVPGSRRWYFTARVWEWVDGDAPATQETAQATGLRRIGDVRSQP